MLAYFLPIRNGASFSKRVFFKVLIKNRLFYDERDQPSALSFQQGPGKA